jgi:hypothetical protein
MVWASLLKEPLEMIHGRPRWALVTVRGGRDVSHTRAARFPVTVVIMDDRGRASLRAQ